MQSRTVLGLYLSALLTAAAPSHAEWTKKLYWADNGSVFRANMDGTATEKLHDLTSTNERVEFIAVDPQNRFLYQSGRTEDTHVGFVIRTDLDGNNPQTLLDGLSGVRYGFAIDPANNKMYFGSDGLRSANLDGSNLALFYGFTSPNPQLGPYYPHDIVVDQANSRLFFSDAITFDGIKSINLDSSSPTNLVSFGPAGNPNDSSDIQIAYDSTNNLLYTTRFRPGEIGVLNLDTLSYQAIVTNIPGVTDIEVDSATSKLYFATASQIFSANLDGSNVTSVITLEVGGDYLADSLEIATVPEIPSIAMMSFAFTVSTLAIRYRRRAT